MESVGDPREAPSTERAFEGEAVAGWSEQVTGRAMAVSVALGTTLSVVAMKLNLTSGLLPSLSIPAALLGFFLLRTWTAALGRCGVLHRPFTRQENAVVQACAVACSSIAFSGGFGTYILAMSKESADGNVGNDGLNTQEPHVGRLMAFLFLVSFVGLFAIIPLRKIMILRHKLTYPSGTATAHLINSFHTPQGAQQAKQQVSLLFKSLGGSIFWALFRWFYAAGMNCGFGAFPTFGLQAYKHGFYFDFSTTNIGVGMICPPLITISMLVGSLISWGILWPYIETKEGIWYPKNVQHGFSGIKGYKVFTGISMILADGLFHFLSILVRTVYTMYTRRKQAKEAPKAPFASPSFASRPALSFDDRRRSQLFLRDDIPDSVAAAGYVILATISVVTIPLLYPQLKWYHIAVAYLIAPAFAFCNAYGTGITDMNLSSSYGKIAMLIFGSWVGLRDGGVVAGLAVCGIIMGIVSTASDLMQDLRTGYLTLTSPRSMLLSQVIGTALGCIINPTIFWVFYNVYHRVGATDFADIPYARVYRGIAILGIDGDHGLPKYSLDLCKAFFAVALAISMLREVAGHRGWRARRYIPSTTGMAVAFFVSPNMTLGMAAGSLAVLLWEKMDGESARVLTPAMASGLICGDALGSLLSSVLTLFGLQPPICIKFLSRDANLKVDEFLRNS